MKNKIGSATKKALRFCCKMIGDQTYFSSLPSIKELSCKAEVSLQTMWKAVQILKDRGVLEPSYAKRLHVLKEAPELARKLISEFDNYAPSFTRNLSVWEQIALDLKRDILTGKYRSDESLPSLKELCNIHKVSFVTLKKSLESLLSEEGLLKRYKKTYSVVPVAASSKNSRIIFSTVSLKFRKLTVGSFSEDFYRLLEAECATAHIKLDPLFQFRENDHYVTINSRQETCEFDDDDSVLGYVILVYYPPDELFERIFKIVSHFNKPVAILDIVGGWSLPRYLHKKDVRFFTAATSDECGSSVARYLLELGHKKVAYISPFHKAEWSQERYRGIKKVYDTAGLNDTANFYGYENPPVIDSFYQDIAHSDMRYDQLLEYYREWRSRVPDRYTQMLDPYFERTFPENIIPRGEFNAQTRSLFDKALTDKDITAWVAANDRVALLALEYLAEKSVQVPKDISVIGFDDTRDALHSSLTSFSFNMREAMHLIFNFLVNTHTLSRVSGKRAVEFGGKIIERATVGKCLK